MSAKALVSVLALSATLVVALTVLAGTRKTEAPASVTAQTSVSAPASVAASTSVAAPGSVAASASVAAPASVAASPSVSGSASDSGKTADPLLSPYDPEVKLGERLFFETRFAQFFFEHSNGNLNAELTDGDPVVKEVRRERREPLDGPFRGQSMNCRQCHFGDDFLFEDQLAGRTYCDFSRRSLMPLRGDGPVRTERNAPLMINLGLAREVPMLLHLDGEFATEEDLVIATMTGRNFGWLPKETSTAVAHIVKVVRADTGVDPHQMMYPDRRGVPYRVAFLGTDPTLPDGLRIPARYRLDVDTASDDQILEAIARLMHAYMDSLRFGTTKTDRESGSPYDLFLEKNQLPPAPKSGESNLAYAQRLLTLIQQRDRPVWVTTDDREFELHEQSFEFGAKELEGLKIFLTRTDPSRKGHVGNCVACHTPPQFTDYSLHNNGVAQGQYDAVFGAGAFAKLDIPDLTARNERFNAYLPASSTHPDATGRFRAAPSAGKPGRADLGVWNVFANPDMPKPQAALTQVLCGPRGPASKSCTPTTVLPLTVAYFKTPSIRDLGQSDPYFHSGEMNTIEDVLRFYVKMSGLARAGKIRNGSPELADVHIDASDVAPLAAFLRSLNEDYN